MRMSPTNQLKSFTHGGQRQKGAVLIFCLVFLLVLTMMGVASMESAVLEERMAGNMQDQSAAFQASEASLQFGENWLMSQFTWPATSADGSTTVWTRDSMDPDAADSEHWWQDNARRTAAWWSNNAIEVDAVEGVATAPHYLIEEMSTITSGQSIGIGSGLQSRVRVFHRVTARGSGVGDTAVVQLQSTFVKTYE
ncbi:MAG: pilus assembly PilX family protein [Gammaproteobacteria bacterium]